MKRFILLYIILVSLSAVGQKAKDSVKTEVIEVTRSFDPKVQDAYKLQVNPEIDALPEDKIPVNYQIQSIPVASTFQPEKGSMAGYQPGSLKQDVYNSYADFSFGNYTQIKTDAFIFYPVSDKLESALAISHYSSQGKATDNFTYLPFYHTAVDALFNYKTNQNIWRFDLGYDGHINDLQQDKSINFITPPDIQNSTNKFNNFHVDVNGDFRDFTIKNFRLKYNNFWDQFDNSEHFIRLNSDLILPIGSIDLKLGLQTDLASGSLGNGQFLNPGNDFNVDYNNLDFGVLPAVQVENDNIIANLGAKLFYQNNANYNQFQFIPDVNIHLNLIYERLTVVAGVTGDLQQNAQTAFYKQNPYTFLTNDLVPSLTPYDIFGGFNGALSSAFAYEIKLGYKKIRNAAFYNYNMAFPPLVSYSVVYDDMTQSYFQTDFDISIGKKLDLKLGLTYMQNNTENLTKPLYLPDYSFKTLFIFKPTEKLNFNLSLNSIGKRTYNLLGDKTLKAYSDLNAGFRYKINKEFTGFI
ncbi:MAG TPA: hypothetical protein ENK64_03775, partial [Flavobacteriales bacterium]|nr:hypothetical protein [Flavobacteriales bacterium]